MVCSAFFSRDRPVMEIGQALDSSSYRHCPTITRERVLSVEVTSSNEGDMKDDGDAKR